MEEKCPTPALATNTSNLPKWLMVACTAFASDSIVLTSDCNANTSKGSALSEAAAVCTALKFRPVIATLIPLSSKTFAIPNPIPLLPPVI